MNFFRRNLIATASAALGLLLFAGVASASTITGSMSTYGNIAAFTAGNGSSTSAGQLNQAALDLAIQSACPAMNVCSGSTVTEIDVIFTTNLTASVSVTNGNGSTSYIGAYGGTPGTFAGGGTSGAAIVEAATIDIADGVTSGFVEDDPAYSVATTNQFKSSACSGTGASSGHFENCLAVAPGTTPYSGTGTDIESGSYTSGTGLSGALSTYIGSGSVNFTITSMAGTNNGNLPGGVTIGSSTESVAALSSGLEIIYDYSYTETPTPEPTTMALVGGALLAIGLIRKKRLS